MAVGGSPAVVATDDYGKSWHVVWDQADRGRPTGSAPIVDLSAMDCQSANVCLVAGSANKGCPPGCDGEFLRTTDGGRRWSIVGKAWGGGSEADVIDCLSGGFCISVGGFVPEIVGTLVVVSRSDGRSWQVPWRDFLFHLAHQTARGIGIALANGVSCTNIRACVLVGGWDGTPGVLVARSVDEGYSWRVLPLS
jgi:hypothetical protein